MAHARVVRVWDGLGVAFSRHVWEFNLDARLGRQPVLRLSSFSCEQRQSARHKWKPVEYWNPIGAVPTGAKKMALKDVPLDDEVEAAALEQIHESITVQKEREK